MVRYQQSVGVGLDPLMSQEAGSKIRGVQTFLAITYDVHGREGNIHESLKEPIAERLAIVAANVVYGVKYYLIVYLFDEIYVLCEMTYHQKMCSFIFSSCEFLTIKS